MSRYLYIRAKEYEDFKLFSISYFKNNLFYVLKTEYFEEIVLTILRVDIKQTCNNVQEKFSKGPNTA